MKTFVGSFILIAGIIAIFIFSLIIFGNKGVDTSNPLHVVYLIACLPYGLGLGVVVSKILR